MNKLHDPLKKSLDLQLVREHATQLKNQRDQTFWTSQNDSVADLKHLVAPLIETEIAKINQQIN